MSVVNISDYSVIVSDKDKQVVQLLSEGNRPLEIADKIGMKIRTLESNLDKMRRVYNCKTREQLVAFFLRNKIIE